MRGGKGRAVGGVDIGVSRSGEGGGREVVGRIEFAKKEAKKGQRFGAPGAVAAILRTPPKTHTSAADGSIRQHPLAYVSSTSASAAPGAAEASLGTPPKKHTSADGSIRQHASAYVSSTSESLGTPPKNQTDEGAGSNEGNQ